MATIDDVEYGICSTLATVLFPAQQYLAGQVALCAAPWIGSVGAPILSFQARLGVGEPASSDMESDLASGISNIAVSHVTGAVKNCTFLRPRWVRSSWSSPTLLGFLQDGKVTFGGMAGPGIVAGVTAGDVCYSYRCGMNDTPATVASAFATYIPSATSQDVVLTAPSISNVRIVADQQAVWCTGQRQAELQVIIIAAPSEPQGNDGPMVRSALTRLVYGLEALTKDTGIVTHFVGLPDGTQAKIYGFDEHDDDSSSRDGMWKRTITFKAMYDSGVTQTQYSVLAPLLLNGTATTRMYWLGNGMPVKSILTDGNGNILGDSAGNMLGTI